MKVRSAHKNKKIKKGCLLAGLVFIGLLAGVGYWWYTTNHNRGDNTLMVNEPPIQDKINYAPPSPEEAQAADEVKDRIVKNQDATPAPSEGEKKTVTPVITSAYIQGGSVYVRGFIAGAIEAAGTCSFIFTKGSQTLAKTSSVTANATTTDCKPLSFDASDLPSGSNGWQVRLAYSSSASAGTSAQQEVTAE